MAPKSKSTSHTKKKLAAKALVQKTAAARKSSSALTLAKRTRTVQPVVPTLDEGMPALLLPLMTNSADRARRSGSNCF